MAYGLKHFTFHRNQASPTTQEARGPPCPTPWNGMGPSGYPRPLSFTSPPIKISLLCLLLLIISVECQNRCEDILQCAQSFDLFKRSYNITDLEMPDPLVICPAVRAYRHCVNRSAANCPGGNILYLTSRTAFKKTTNMYKCNFTSGTIAKIPKAPWVAVPDTCMYQGKKVFRHCGLFGDPHLRTFDGVFQTCRVRGAWQLIDNDYLTVMVTNDAVEGNANATATSKLTVIVKGNVLCTSKNFQTYQAENNNLPGSFQDSHISYGPYRSVEIVEVNPGSHVEIHIRYIETVVVIRQIGRYFTFSIKMPEELIESSDSSSAGRPLCSRGCPRSEIIDYKKYLAIRKQSLSQQPAVWSRQKAEEVCRNANLVDFYFDSCVYDLMATGDENFTMSAVHALQDVVRLQPQEAAAMSNRSSLESYESYGRGGNGQSSSMRQPLLQSTLVIQFLVVLILTFFISQRTFSISR